MSKEINLIENKNKNSNDINQQLISLTNENNIILETYKKFNSIIYNSEELNQFKDNILSLLKERDKIYLNKLIHYKEKTEKIQSDFDATNKITNSKFSKVIDNQAKMSSRLDQLDNYETFVSKTNDKLTSHEVRITNMREDFSNATQKYDKIYLDNLELPGYIGRGAKYKNCQNFFLDVIKDLAKLNKYREKNIIDLKMYKEKLETLISSMNSILDNNNESQIKYINETKEKILKDCNNMFESVCENMKEIRVENSKYAVDLISQSMDLSKKWEKLEKIREDLLEKFNYSVNKYQMLTDDTIKSFEEFKTEYGIIRRKFMELAEFIKDVRFRKNIGENVKKKEIKKMVKKMLKKRKSFDGKDVRLLSDISNIENIDYKKYYHVETKNEEINDNNNDDRSNSMKLNQNKKNKKNNLLNINNKRKNYSTSKEMLYKRELNQSAEENYSHRINIKNPLASSSNINNIPDQNAKSINIAPISIKNLKTSNNNNSAIVSSRNNNNNNMNNKKENNIDIKFRNELPLYEKNNELKRNNNNKNKEYIKEKNDKNKNIKEKIKKDKNEKEIIDANINSNNEVIIEINKENNNNQNQHDNNNNMYIKEEAKNIQKNTNNINKIDQTTKLENKEKYNNKEITYIENNNQNKDIINNNENNKIKPLENNSINKDKNEVSTQYYDNNNYDNIIGKNDDNSQISLSRVMSHSNNIEIKSSMIDDSSSISDVYNLNSNKNYKNNNNFGLSSEKSLSFISDNNNNNINKFLINDIQIVNNDRIIKELASELEQSTAKKDKLASNKKEIEQKFKNACSNIEPIDLLGKKENGIKHLSNSKEKKNNIIKNTEVIEGKIVSNNEQEEQIINHKINNTTTINNNQNQIISNKKNVINIGNNNDNINNPIKDFNNDMNNNNQNYNSNVNNNYNNNTNDNINFNDNNNNEDNIEQNNNNINFNEVHPTKSTEEDNNYIICIKNKNNNELSPIPMAEDNNNDKNNNKILNNINKNVNESINNLNPIRVNNEIHINEGPNSNVLNKKIHAVDQKLLNLELFTKEKILDIFSQINLIKHTCKLPIDNTFEKEKSILDSSRISLPNKIGTNPNYKTLNNSFMNNSNINIQNSFYNEKNKENISSNINDNNRNIHHINNNNSNNSTNNLNSQYLFNNINLDKKRYSLKEVNPKQSLINQKMKKNNLNSINNPIINNNAYLNYVMQNPNNNLTENNNVFSKNCSKNGNLKDIIDGNITNKILQNISGDINNKFVKDFDKKNENGNLFKNNNNVGGNEDATNKGSNKSLNNGTNKNNFAYSNSKFTGTEIKLVDLNKLVNHQLPRNKLIPIHINDNDYLVSLKSK